MKIRQLQIHSFGKLKNWEINLEDGINIIYGPNESGKSTMHAFIRAMLYGIQRQRGRAARSDTYSRYEPWENSSFYSGRMRFESGGKIFRLSRNFYKNDIKEELVCETDGECLSIAQGDLEVLLGNISESVFDNTIFIEQLRSRTGDELDVQLRNFMANYEGSSDGELDIEKAKAILKAQRKEYEQKQRLELAKQETQKKQFTIKMEYVQEELQGIEAQIKQRKAEWLQRERAEGEVRHRRMTENDHQTTPLQREVEKEKLERNRLKGEQLRNGRLKDKQLKDEQLKSEQLKDEQLKSEQLRHGQSNQEEVKELDKKPSQRPVIAAAAGILCFGLAVISWFSKFPGWITAMSIFIGVVIFGAMLLVRAGRRNNTGRIAAESPKNQREYPSDQKTDGNGESAIQEEAERHNEYKQHLRWKIEQLEEARKEKMMLFENLQTDYEEYCSIIREDDKNQEEIDSITIALDSIEEISSNMQKYWEKDLHRRISAIMQEITAGRYTGAEVTDSRRIALHTKEQYVPLEQASHGTIDQLYFSLRMAAADYLCQEEAMPVLLDEVFAMYDEERLQAALKWLAENEEQVLIFTCRQREVEIAEQMNLQAHKVLL